jgi:hypothetical protein
VLAAAALAAPVGASNSLLLSPLGACSPRTLTVTFDPRSGVRIVGDGQLLASATYDRRSATRACGAVVTTSPPHTPKPIARRVVVTCRVRRPLQIETHPIVPSGSQVIVAERDSDTWFVSAVLKPGGSRVYVFSDACSVR